MEVLSGKRTRYEPRGSRKVALDCHYYDHHATLLHLFGLDHEKLTYQRNGAELSLTDKQGARVVTELLA
jgi:hypothetical protein